MAENVVVPLSAGIDVLFIGSVFLSHKARVMMKIICLFYYTKKQVLTLPELTKVFESDGIPHEALIAPLDALIKVKWIRKNKNSCYTPTALGLKSNPQESL
jgi:hypothetical protein